MSDYEDEGGDYSEIENDDTEEESETESEESEIDDDSLSDSENTDGEANGEDENENENENENDEKEDITDSNDGGMKAHASKKIIDPIVNMSNKSIKIRVVPPNERITDNRLHKNEAARIIAMRAAQIEKDAISFEPPELQLSDPVDKAIAELMHRRNPMTLRRHLSTNKVKGGGIVSVVEEWVVNEMTLPPLSIPNK